MTVYVLITWDVDPLTRDEVIRERLDAANGSQALLRTGLNLATELLAELKIGSTFLISGTVAEDIKEELGQLAAVTAWDHILRLVGS